MFAVVVFTALMLTVLLFTASRFTTLIIYRTTIHHISVHHDCCLPYEYPELVEVWKYHLLTCYLCTVLLFTILPFTVYTIYHYYHISTHHITIYTIITIHHITIYTIITIHYISIYRVILIYHIIIYRIAIYHITIYRIAIYHIAIYHITIYHITIYNITIYHTTIHHIHNSPHLLAVLRSQPRSVRGPGADGLVRAAAVLPPGRGGVESVGVLARPPHGVGAEGRSGGAHPEPVRVAQPQVSGRPINRLEDPDTTLSLVEYCIMLAARSGGKIRSGKRVARYVPGSTVDGCDQAPS